MSAPLPSAGSGTKKADLEIADILRRYLPEYLRTHQLTQKQFRVFRSLISCRTGALGGHMMACDHCGYQKPVYHSCGDRHCPKCQGLAGLRWVKKRISEILPVPHYHVVFTLPHLLNPLIRHNRKQLYDLLFQASAETLKVFSLDSKHLGASPGFFGVLHTWSQTLIFHLHIHYLLPAGGLNADGSEWISHPGGNRFLFPVKALSKVFRGIFIRGLKKLYASQSLMIPDSLELSDARAFDWFLDQAVSRKWHVYAKRPFSGPEEVIGYIGRYTHRVAISNHRLKSMDGGVIRFTYQDRKNHPASPKTREMRLPFEEFIRRYKEHILPGHYHKIRFFGFMANGRRSRNLKIICRSIDRQKISVAWNDGFIQRFFSSMERKERVCPVCSGGTLKVLDRIKPIGYRFVEVADTG